MNLNNPKLFPVFSVMTAASVITGVCGIAWLVANQMGQGYRLVSMPMDDAQTLVTTPHSGGAGRLSSSAFSSTLGTHEATVLRVVAAKSAVAEGAANLSPIWIASGSYDNTVKLWAISNDGTLIEEAGGSAEGRSLSHNGRVNDLVFLPGDRPNEQRLLTGSGSGEIKLWEISTGKAITTIADQSGRVMSLAVSPNQSHLASGTSEGTLKVWPVEAIASQKSQTNLQGKVLKAVGPQINALVFHPTQPNLLVSGDQEGGVQVWDLEKKQMVRSLESDADRVVSLSISADGKYVASGSYDKQVRIWDLETGELIRTLSGHDFVVADVAFSPDGNLLASGSYDESIKVWNWRSERELCSLKGHSGFVYSVAFSPDGATLISGGYDGSVRTWALGRSGNQACLN